MIRLAVGSTIIAAIMTVMAMTGCIFDGSPCDVYEDPCVQCPIHAILDCEDYHEEWNAEAIRNQFYEGSCRWDYSKIYAMKALYSNCRVTIEK